MFASSRRSLRAAGIVIATVAAITPALATCKNLVCTSGSDDGLKRTHVVYLTSQMSGATHYNVVPPGGKQFELHIDHFSFDIQPGQSYTYSVQVCKRGNGPFASSTCANWAQFTHTVQ